MGFIRVQCVLPHLFPFEGFVGLAYEILDSNLGSRKGHGSMAVNEPDSFQFQTLLDANLSIWTRGGIVLEYASHTF
jgi:hypothetical protein